jgi:cytochrome c-type biogenesis protein CcmH/NrfG
MKGNTRRHQFPASERDGSRPPRWVRSFRVVLAGATVALALAATGGLAAAQQPDGPWLNTALSPNERAALLVRAMTLEEKVARPDKRFDQSGIPQLRRRAFLADAAGARTRGTSDDR